MLDHFTWRSLFFAGILSYASCTLQFQPTSVQFRIEECKAISLSTKIKYHSNATINLHTDHDDVVRIDPQQIVVENKYSWMIRICGKAPGSTVISATIDNLSINDVALLHLTVGKSYALEILGTIVGWIYFAVWSISFYPQMYENYSRKSVVGLSFDFIALNTAGFSLYSVYNCALYYLPAIQRYPKSWRKDNINATLNKEFISNEIDFEAVEKKLKGEILQHLDKRTV